MHSDEAAAKVASQLVALSGVPLSDKCARRFSAFWNMQTEALREDEVASHRDFNTLCKRLASAAAKIRNIVGDSSSFELRHMASLAEHMANVSTRVGVVGPTRFCLVDFKWFA